MKKISFLLLFSITLMLASCDSISLNEYKADNEAISIMGRTETTSDNRIRLIGSAASVSIGFTGNTCKLKITNDTPDGLQNYFVIELDGKDMGRFTINGEEEQTFTFEATSDQFIHEIRLIKATEASNGYIIFNGIACDSVVALPSESKAKIEFIGDSITCGMGVAHDEIACYTDQWYDQHNAYLAYGPRIGRALNVDYMLSSVSGIGVYRNWNGIGPVMPTVYENTYLNENTNNKWDFKNFQPDLVSICLGTNDLSDGDGENERLPFDIDQFSASYIEFVERIYGKYPRVQVALLTSPMVSGEKGEWLLTALNRVKDNFAGSENPPIEIFEFENITPRGCGYHPDDDDQAIMANQLQPFYENLLDL